MCLRPSSGMRWMHLSAEPSRAPPSKPMDERDEMDEVQGGTPHIILCRAKVASRWLGMPTCAAIKFWPTLNPTKPPTVHACHRMLCATAVRCVRLREIEDGREERYGAN